MLSTNFQLNREPVEFEKTYHSAAFSRLKLSKMGLLLTLFATASAQAIYPHNQSTFSESSITFSENPINMPTLKIMNDLFAKVDRIERASERDEFFLTCSSHLSSHNAILAKELGSLYDGPITDPEKIRQYVPEGNSRVLDLGSKHKIELFISSSGVPVIAHHSECFDRLCDYTIPLEAVYNAIETTDTIMTSVEPHIRKRILDTRLYVHITDASTFGLQDYGGWFRTVNKQSFENNEVAISPNTLLPKMNLCRHNTGMSQFKPGTSRNNALVHELTHVVQALLPYRKSQGGPMENWVDLTTLPPHIRNAIEKQFKNLGLDIDINDSARVDEWISGVSSIEGLSQDDVWLATDIVFNQKVQLAYKAAKNNPSYQEPINPKAVFDDYQFNEDSDSDWHTAGTEYFAELVSGAFGMNKEYAFDSQKAGVKAFVGRMSSPKWIQDHDPIGWRLVMQKFSQLNSRFCTMPLLKTMPFCG